MILWLSRWQRDVLIDHLDGVAVPIVHPANLADAFKRHEASSRYQSTLALLARGFLKTDKKITSMHTRITDEGRAAISAALADWAEALIRAEHRSDDAILPDLRWRQEPVRPKQLAGGMPR